MYKYKYITPANFSDMFMSSDGKYLTGLWFEGSSDEEKHKDNLIYKELPIFKDTCLWLDEYFKGNSTNFTPLI